MVKDTEGEMVDHSVYEINKLISLSIKLFVINIQVIFAFSHEEFETMLPPTLAYINALLSTAVQSVNIVSYRLPNFFLRFEAEWIITGVTFVT